MNEYYAVLKIIYTSGNMKICKLFDRKKLAVMYS